MNTPQYTRGPVSYDVEPAQPLSGLLPAVGAGLAKREQDATQEEMAEILQAGDPQMVAQWMAKNPEYAEQMATVQGFKDELTKNNAIESAHRYLRGEITPVEALRRRIAMVRSRGGNPAETEELLQAYMEDPIGNKPAVDRAALMTLAIHKPDAYKAITGQGTSQALSPVGKLYAEMNKLPEGDPMRDRYQQAIAKQVSTAGLPSSVEKNMELYTEATGYGPGHPQYNKTLEELLRSSKVVDEGGGQSRLVNPIGGPQEDPLVTQEDYADRESDTVANVQLRKQDVEQVPIALDKAGKIGDNIRNLREVYNAIERGAGVGPLYDMMPSFRAATRELDSLRGSLALDIVGASQFGALSAGELALATQVGLPTGLDEESLRQYIERKIAAQQKLREQYVEFANYIQNGGSRAEWEQANIIKEAQDSAYDDDDPLDNPPKVTSQAEYDAIPSGGFFMEDGKRLQKP